MVCQRDCYLWLAEDLRLPFSRRSFSRVHYYGITRDVAKPLNLSLMRRILQEAEFPCRPTSAWKESNELNVESKETHAVSGPEGAGVTLREGRSWLIAHFCRRTAYGRQ